MPVRMIKREELLECEKIQSIAFAYPLDTAKHEKEIEEGTDPVDPYIGYFNEDNVVTACLELPAYQMRYEGHWVPMVGIGGVASLPEYRFGGAVRQIMEASLRQMFEEGAVFPVLYPFSHPYYRQFGYELCETVSEYEVPIKALSSFRFAGKARMVLPGDSLGGLKAVFDAFYPRYNMSVQREDRHWENLLGKDAYKERVYTYLLEDEDDPSAYVVLETQGGESSEKTCYVRELAFTRPQGFTDVLGFLYRLAAQYPKMRLPLPEDIPLTALVDESYELKRSIANQQMARVVNVQRALECKRHFAGAAYTLRVLDDGLPENDGVFSVCCENGRVSAEKTAGEDADLTLDVRTLGQMLLGFLPLDEAMFKKDVQVRANAETLRNVFVRRPVFLTEHF